MQSRLLATRKSIDVTAVIGGVLRSVMSLPSSGRYSQKPTHLGRWDGGFFVILPNRPCRSKDCEMARSLIRGVPVTHWVIARLLKRVAKNGKCYAKRVRRRASRRITDAGDIRNPGYPRWRDVSDRSQPTALHTSRYGTLRARDLSCHPATE